MNKDEKFILIKVTTTHHYFVPMIDDKRTDMDGRTPKELIDEWFYDNKFPIDYSHASRDSHRIKGSGKVIADKIIKRHV